MKAENTSFKLTTYENLDDFYKFDQLLKDKVIEKNIVREITFTVLFRLSVLLIKFHPPLNKRTNYLKKYKYAPPQPHPLPEEKNIIRAPG